MSEESLRNSGASTKAGFLSSLFCWKEIKYQTDRNPPPRPPLEQPSHPLPARNHCFETGVRRVCAGFLVFAHTCASGYVVAFRTKDDPAPDVNSAEAEKPGLSLASLHSFSLSSLPSLLHPLPLTSPHLHRPPAAHTCLPPPTPPKPDRAVHAQRLGCCPSRAALQLGLSHAYCLYLREFSTRTRELLKI